MLLSFNVLAHGSLLNLSKMAISESLVVFENSQSEPIVRSYSGVKAWSSKGKIKVRVYFDNNKSSIVYQCEMKHFDDGSESMVCS